MPNLRAVFFVNTHRAEIMHLWAEKFFQGSEHSKRRNTSCVEILRRVLNSGEKVLQTKCANRFLFFLGNYDIDCAVC